jgi:hypothetical protein
VSMVYETNTNAVPGLEQGTSQPQLPPTAPPTLSGTSAVVGGASPVTSEPVTDALPGALKANWGKLTQATLSDRMYRQIQRLATVPGDAHPGSRLLGTSCLSNFLEFWAHVHNDATEPDLVLAPDGTLYAEWFKSARQKLDVRFTSSTVTFGLFANTDILEGAQRPAAVAALLSAHAAKPLRWSPR